MKYVLYMGIIYMPDGNAAAQRAQAFIEMIKTCGYIPVILGMEPNIKDSNILKSKKEYKGAVVFSHCYPGDSISWFKKLFDIKGIQAVINYLGCDNIKAVIAMDYFSPALIRIMSLCKKAKIRLIIDTVDWFDKSNYSFPKNLVKDLDTYIRMKFVYKQATYMITISKYLYRYYKNQVPNIVEIPGVFVTSETTEAIARYQGNKLLKLAFVGSPGKKCEKEKIDWVIKIVCELNEKKKCCEFVIAGIDKKTLEEYRPDLTSLKTFDASIKCLGRISHDACIKLLVECDFSIIVREETLLSKAGFPTKLGESYACGIPVLVTPAGNLVEYVPDGYGIVADGCTYDAVKDVIKRAFQCSREQINSMHLKVADSNLLDCHVFIENMRKVLE